MAEPRGHETDECEQPGRDSAPRRTVLAAERTYLAWLRTSLGAFGMALAVGRLLPALLEQSHVGFALLGLGYGGLGLLTLGLMTYRSYAVRRALRADAPLPAQAWMPWVLSAVAAVLGVFTMLLVVAAA